MNKTIWTFGLISGAVFVATLPIVTLYQDDIGFDRGWVVGYTTMVIAFLMVFFGVRSYRDKVGGGSISFGRALVVGSLIAFISSACYVATWEVIYFKGSPDFLKKYSAYVVEKAKASGASQAELDKKAADMQKLGEMYKNPIINSAMTFVEPLPVGLVIALVSAGILRRRRDGNRAPLNASVAV